MFKLLVSAILLVGLIQLVSCQAIIKITYVGPSRSGSGKTCYTSDALTVSINSTNSCSPRCSNDGSQFTLITCNEPLKLNPNNKWIGATYFTYGDCNQPYASYYETSNTCAGVFNFGYDKCSRSNNKVDHYSCADPFCQKCKVSSSVPVDQCLNGVIYECISYGATPSSVF